MLARGVVVTYETIRSWCAKFGPDYAAQLRRRRPRPGDGIVKLFGNACGAVDVSGLGGERWWLTASFKPLRR